MRWASAGMAWSCGAVRQQAVTAGAYATARAASRQVWGVSSPGPRSVDYRPGLAYRGSAVGAVSWCSGGVPVAHLQFLQYSAHAVSRFIDRVHRLDAGPVHPLLVRQQHHRHQRFAHLSQQEAQAG